MRSCQFFMLLAITALLISCKNKVEVKATLTETTAPLVPKPDSLGIYQVAGDSLIIPSFSVDIELSPKARKRIEGSGETIILDAFYTGEPKDTAGVELEEDGEYYIAESRHEIKPGTTVHFENVKFPKAKYLLLKDKDIDVLVNVYTGRHTTEDNLLNSDIVADKASKLANRHFVVKAKLIYGDD